VLSNAYQQAQLQLGGFNTETLSVGDLFMGAIVPGILLVVGYMAYVIFTSATRPEKAPPAPDIEPIPLGRILSSLLPPIALMVLVLGSIVAGFATPTEASAVGALGATLLAAAKGKLTLPTLRAVGQGTLEMTAMVFLILIGASIFSLVFRGYGGDHLVHSLFTDMPGGVFGAMLVVMLVIFLLGFILDFIEITFVVVPIVGPVLMVMGIDPIWLGIMIAVNLQTSFLTPPFGFALFYLRGVTPESVPTSQIYRGVIPFIAIQLLLLMAMAIWPSIVTWLPDLVSNG
jgi:tripartite ATP-independent transporter DctM subunit